MRKKENLEILVSRLEDGARPSGDPWPAGLLVSRLDFDLQFVDIPNVPKKEVEGLIHYRLRSIYPGNPRDTAFDFKIESDGMSQRAIVFITRKATLEKYKNAARQKPLFFPYSLIQRIARAQKDIRTWFCAPGWAEHSVYRGGMLSSCTVLTRKGQEPFQLEEAEAALPENIRMLPALVIAFEDELPAFRAALGPDGASAMRFLSVQELSRSQRKVEGFFSEPKRVRAVFAPGVRIAALAVITATLAALVFYKSVWRAEDNLGKLKRSNLVLVQQSAKATALQKEVDALRMELSRMSAEKPEDIYVFLSELTRVLGSEVLLRSLHIQSDTFQIEAVGSNPLKLMENFRENAFFDSVKLSQVVPDPRLGRERFSLSGVFHAR